jgi:NOL1/NOP2/fmu family ribosome biogenesis protein
MFRKDPSSVGLWSPKLVRTSAERQAHLLSTAAKLVRIGGLLIYTTCTFNPEENEAVVDTFIKSRRDFKLVELSKLTGLSPGQPTWIEDGNEDLKRTVRIWPHLSVGEGHFIAILQKIEGKEQFIVPGKPQNLPKKDRILLDDFWQENMIDPLPADWRLNLRGNRVYLMHEDTPDLNGLNVLHWGTWLGTLKKGRFEPAHPMVMTLPAEMFKENLDLQCDSEDVRAYLRAETIDVPGPPGWIRISVDGFSLGWGKRVNDRIKSQAPRWLRNIY